MASQGQKNGGASNSGDLIWEPTSAMLNGAQAKLTWLGTQSKPIPTVVFSVAEISVPAFQALQGDTMPYGNDSTPYTRSFKINAKQFQDCLDGLHPVLSDLADESPKSKALRSNERGTSPSQLRL